MKDVSDYDLKITQLPRTLREITIDRLRGAIIAGRFASGARLVERPLCDQLGVSRSVVREAIRYLEAEGLVETAPRVGPIVASLDWNLAQQIYDIRMLLETQAAFHCARKADKPAKSLLTKALKSLESGFRDAQPQKLYEATTHFYEVIFTIAGHEVAWEVVQRLNGRISRLRAMTLATTDRRMSGQARMTRIYEAIVANDPERAAQAVREHLAEAAELARRLLESTPQMHLQADLK